LSGRSVIRCRRDSHDSRAEAAVADAGFVQENVPKRLPIKRDLYACIDTALRSDGIAGSSTAGLAVPASPPGLPPRIRATRRPAILSSMAKH
jgi:3-hydroxyacyl-CoA dehydrogenase